MGIPISCKSVYQLRSESLRNNEELVHLYKNYAYSFLSKLEQFPHLRYSESRDIQYIIKITYQIRCVDELLLMREKKDWCREILPGIMLLTEQEFCPVLRLAISLLKNCCLPSFSSLSVMNSIDFLQIENRLLELWILYLYCQPSSGCNVVMLAVVLRSLIFQYLIGCVPNSGSKTYSSGSLEFRDTFVSLVLFQGAYVWIKFRQVASPSTRRKRKSCETPDHASPFNDACDVLEGVQEGVYRRAMKDRLGTITHYKYEPRFKPPRERLESGDTLKFNCLSLGQYNTHQEAQIVRQIAVFFYGKEECRLVQLVNGLCFSIPSMSEEEKSFSGMEKAKCVARKTKAVYAEFLKEKKARKLQLRNTAVETDSQFSHGNDSRTCCSQAAEIQVCEPSGTSNTEFTLFPDVEPSRAPLEFDLSAAFGGFEDMFDELGSLWANAPAPQPSALDNGGVTEIVAHPCSLQADGAAAQGLEHIERQLMSPQMVSLLGQVNHLQQLVTHQKKRLEDSAMWNVELQHQLMESDIRKSELQRENERLRTMLQQVPISHVAGIITGFDIPKGRNAG